VFRDRTRRSTVKFGLTTMPRSRLYPFCMLMERKISLELSVTSRMEACASLLHSMSEKGESAVEMHAWLLESPWHGTSAL